MQIECYETAHDAAVRVVSIIASTVRAKPDALLVLPTGQTPLPVYRLLPEGRVDLSRVRAINLDEYVGLPQTDPRSYGAYLRRELSGAGSQDPSAHGRRYLLTVLPGGGSAVQPPR
jgi:glucosamine-6-phosphate deaminase